MPPFLFFSIFLISFLMLFRFSRFSRFSSAPWLWLIFRLFDFFTPSIFSAGLIDVRDTSCFFHRGSRLTDFFSWWPWCDFASSFIFFFFGFSDFFIFCFAFLFFMPIISIERVGFSFTVTFHWLFLISFFFISCWLFSPADYYFHFRWLIDFRNTDCRHFDYREDWFRRRRSFDFFFFCGFFCAGMLIFIFDWCGFSRLISLSLLWLCFWCRFSIFVLISRMP